MHTSPATAPTYWDHVKHYLRHAFGLFGEPEAIARQQWLLRRDHKLLIDYLRPLEALIRRLIFIAALQITPMTHPVLPETKFRARLASAANTGAHFDTDNAETWRVQFKLEPRAKKRKPKRAKKPSAPVVLKFQFVSSAASALRLEAIIRAYKSRDALAEQLARKIALNTGVAHSFTWRPHKKLVSKVIYATLFDVIALAADAYQGWIQRRLRHTDSS